MKIVFFELEKSKQAPFSGSFAGADISFFEEKLNENNAEKAKAADIICVFINSTINKNVIDALPNLKFIATRSTGFDHIDLEYANSKGIKVSNVPGYGSYTVAEFTFGLILNLSRNIISANSYVRESLDFNYSSTMKGFDLRDKTLGIIGTGKIGKNVAKIAKAFEMKVIAHDLYPDLAFANENNFMYKSFEEVISQSDIITLHTPYNRENHHLINEKNISKMKKGVYLINTARGELIDTEALLFGFKKGIIAGAGLDVLEAEKELKEKNSSNTATLNKELMKMQNVIITPHIAFYTKEALAEILKITGLNIKGFLENKPENLVK